VRHIYKVESVSTMTDDEREILLYITLTRASDPDR
jgi:hypothetical protein